MERKSDNYRPPKNVQNADPGRITDFVNWAHSSASTGGEEGFLNKPDAIGARTLDLSSHMVALNVAMWPTHCLL